MFVTKNIIYHFKKQKTATYVLFKIYILLVSNKGFLFTTRIATASVSINITALLALRIALLALRHLLQCVNNLHAVCENKL